MLNAERVQAFIHKLDVQGARRMNYVALTLAMLTLAIWYDLHCYHNFNAPEAMDAAQVARNVAEGRGFSTEFIRPLSIYLVQTHNGLSPATPPSTNAVDYAELNGNHPDLANAPLYPLILAGCWKIYTPDWTVDRHHQFWSEGGRFLRYGPEFFIAISTSFCCWQSCC